MRNGFAGAMMGGGNGEEAMYKELFLSLVDRSFGVELNNKELTSVGDYAFWNCTNIGNIILPNVVSIGARAFATNIRTSTSNITIVRCPKCKTVGTFAFNLAGRNLVLAKTEYYFDSVETIEESAFSQSGLHYFESGTSLRSIGNWAFQVREGYHENDLIVIKSTTMPSIGSSTFNGTGSYTTVKFPNLTKAVITSASGYPWGLTGGTIVASDETWVV